MPGELKGHLVKPSDALRSYLAGDAPLLIHAFFETHAGGRFHMALDQLEDAELEKIIADNAERIDLILSNTGQGKAGDGGDDEDGGTTGQVWDARNNPARARLIT